ncbi:MAG: diguanylate cyclase [Nitrospirae bacterium]|nr:diguanylate cyclase [Nitrospirota bacterium]MBF0555665.1 diguanylate cyclase [Nitrospirota bacterium]
MSSKPEDSITLAELLVKTLQELLASRIPPKIPDELTKVKGFQQLYSTLIEIRSAIMAFSTGDLNYRVSSKGYVPGAIKSLQAALLHLTWQTKMIASGDFTQRVDFMGDFSESFNSMVKQLEENMRKLNISNLLLQDFNIQLEHAARTDPLTGINNRGYFSELLKLEMERITRYGHACTVLMLDIDHFKSINDTYGHAAGDEALRTLTSIIQECARKNDFYGRLGGEEFAITLPETDIHGAAIVAERLRANLETTVIKFDSHELFVTASIGVSQYQAGDTMETLLHRADQAMYEAKKNGRNRVCLSSVG